MLRWLKRLFTPPEPTGPAVVIADYTCGGSTISQDVVQENDGCWKLHTRQDQSVPLFVVETPGVGSELCQLTYRAELRTEGVTGRAYLEMWCRIPGRGEFFSKGLHNTVTGSTDWASYETPFYLKPGQRPDQIKLNLAVEGGGAVWIRSVALFCTPMG